MPQTNCFYIIHETPVRIRYYVELLKNQDIDQNRLQYAFEQIEGVSSVRISPKTYSIIITFKGDIRNKIKNTLRNLQIKNLKRNQADTLSSSDEMPSLMGLVRAGSALAIEPFINDQRIKAGLTTAAATPMLWDGTKELFTDGLTSKVLESAAVAVSIYRQDYLAANSTNAMLELGEYIEETTVQKSDELIKHLAKPNIKTAWLEITDEQGKTSEQQVSTNELQVGDIIVVGAGDTISIDGHIISGDASVNQVSMTGEAEPVKKSRGDRVIAGTVVEEGRIKIWAEQVGADTSTHRIQSYIESSLHEKSAVQLKATKMADKLVPVTLGLAASSYIFTRDFERVAAVLQADYSCALKLATPVAFKSTLSHAGNNGIMIKGAKSIEALTQVDTFIFDKTGTLTEGELEVDDVISFDPKWSDEELLNLTASMEEHYFHPVAEAIVKAAKTRGFVHMHHEEVQFIVAHGVKTVVDGVTVLIGSRHFLEEDEKVSFKGHIRQINTLIKSGKTLLYIAYKGKLLGTISLTDKVRDNAAQAISRLRASGVKNMVMLTGDTKEKAAMIADELGIDKIYAELKPTDKADIVQQFKDEGKTVAFVGDGINDAPALITADVSFSMHRGADITKATADIALLKDDIETIADARELADKTMKLINANFNATVGVNTGILTAATFGLISPITTAVLHNGTTILLLMNSIKGVSLRH